MKHCEISLTLLRGWTILIILTIFETNLKIVQFAKVFNLSIIHYVNKSHLVLAYYLFY